MPQKTIREVIHDTVRDEMRRDPTVILMGEDVAGGAGCSGEDDAFGGAFGFYKGLVGEFGRGRVIDTPISEAAYIGAAAGAAMTGLRPIADLQFFDFLGVCFDQVYNQMAKFRYMFGGKSDTPLVMLSLVGAGLRCGAQHSQSLHPQVTAVPGLKVVMPENAYDTKGLLLTAIRDDDPVIFLLHKLQFENACEVPDEEYLIPFGQAHIKREGGDVTLVATSSMVQVAEEAAETLAREGISAEVIDPRTIVPLDEETILKSVRKTSRAIVIDEGHQSYGVTAEIAARISEKAFYHLDAPVIRMGAMDVPVPFSPALEDLTVPTAAGVVENARKICRGELIHAA